LFFCFFLNILFIYLYFFNLIFKFDTELLDLPWYYSNKHITSTNLGIVVTLAASTLIKLFIEMLNLFIFSSKEQKICEGK
jgi:hypothetical protein